MTKDMELIGEMDPYVVLKYQNQKFWTTVHGEGGKTPVWNQTF
jgi:Ca2+-dependent lipid-binding protein